VHFTTWTTKPGQKTNFRQYSCAGIQIWRTIFVTYCIIDSLVSILWKVWSVLIKLFYKDFYYTHMLSMSALELTTLFWTLMTSFDFKHVLTLLSPISHWNAHVYPHISPVTFTRMWVCICKGLGTKLLESYFFRVWTWVLNWECHTC
jgi:hypothetical protein